MAAWYTCRYPDEGPPPRPPDPPTPGDVYPHIAPYLLLDVNYSPKVRGLTGLDTYLWCTNPPTITNHAVQNGWDVVATSGLTAVSWSIAGPDAAAAGVSALKVPGGSGCGDEQHPSGAWMPNTMGMYQLTANGTWSSSYTMSYSDTHFDITEGPVSMGSSTLSGAPIDYEVIEHVGVLVG